MKIVNYENCFGCSACEYVCPAKCITMEYDRFGFYYPKVNNDLCVGCKKCISVCPVHNDVETTDIKKIYKGYAKDIESELNQKSTSGAIFALLANQIIEDNGIVFGVSFDKDFRNVSHIGCRTTEQVDKCRGSKYIQSQTQGVYKQVAERIKEGDKVLFSGTPCQVAALRSCLGNSADNVLTVDFVCHGVGSTTFYQKFLSKVTDGKGASEVSFRDKRDGYINMKCVVFDTAFQQVYKADSYCKDFGKAFANNLISRLSCGGCKYASVHRVADITLADNIIFTTEKEKNYGSSLMFINTKKGLELFEKVKEKAVTDELKKENVIPQIMHLNHPAVPHRDREKLLNAFNKHGYEAACRFITEYKAKTTFKESVKNFIRPLIKKFN